MRAPGLFLCLLLCCSQLLAQNHKAELRDWLQKTERDTTWIKEVSNHAIESYKDIGPFDSLYHLGELISAESERLDFDWGRFYGEYLKGSAVIKQYPDSAFNYDKLGLSKISPDEKLLKLIFTDRLTTDYYSIRDYKRARYFVGHMITAAEAMDDQEQLAIAYSRRGLFFNWESKFAEAFSSFIKAIEVAEKAGFLKVQRSAFINIGIIYDNLKDYETALEYYQKGLEVDKRMAKESGTEYLMDRDMANNIGRIMGKTGEYEKGKSYLAVSLSQYPEEKDPGGERYPYYNLGNIHLTDGNLDSAAYYLKQSLEIAAEYNDPYIIALASHDLGQLLDQEQNASEAEKRYLQSYEAASVVNIANNQFINAAYRLYEINLQKGNKSKALDYLKNWGIAKDSLYNLESTKQVARLEMEYDFESEKQALIAASEREQLILENELERRTIFQYALLAIAFLILLIALNFYRSNQRRKKANGIIRKQNAELSQSSAQIRQLSTFKEGLTNMIAHDMKNSLNTILGLSKSGKPLDSKKTNAVQLAGSSILNLVSNMLDVQKFEEAKVNLNKERSPIKTIIDRAKGSLEPLLQSKSIILHCQITDLVSINLDPEIIHRVLINLLTNAVKYTPSGSEIDLVVRVEYEGESRHALISVTDQGTGVDEQFIPKLFDKFTQSEARSLGSTGSSGLGLHFCKLAIEAHGGKIWATSKPGQGLTVFFSLPIDKTDIARIETEASSNRGQAEPQNEFGFEPSEIERIAPYIQKLKAFKVYEIKQIRKVLAEMKSHELNTTWQEQVWTAALHGDQERFEALLELKAEKTL